MISYKVVAATCKDGRLVYDDGRGGLTHNKDEAKSYYPCDKPPKGFKLLEIMRRSNSLYSTVGINHANT